MQESKEPLVSVLFKEAEEGTVNILNCFLPRCEFNEAFSHSATFVLCITFCSPSISLLQLFILCGLPPFRKHAFMCNIAYFRQNSDCVSKIIVVSCGLHGCEAFAGICRGAKFTKNTNRTQSSYFCLSLLCHITSVVILAIAQSCIKSNCGVYNR